MRLSFVDVSNDKKKFTVMIAVVLVVMCRYPPGKRVPKLLDFVLADDIEADAPVIAVAWLGEQVRCLLCIVDTW